jgi:hypothetical protein
MDTHTDADTREGTNNNSSETCDEAEEEACSGNIIGTNNDDDSDTVKDLESNAAQEESYVERGAHVLNHPFTSRGEQIDPPKMPALSENKQQIQTLGPVGAFGEGGGEQSDLQVDTSAVDSKRSYHTLAPANEGASEQQVGAFREDGGEQLGLQVGTTRSAVSKRSRELGEDESVIEQDEESAVMIVHATLVVEEGSRRQDSHSSSASGEGRSNNNDIAVEDGSETRRPNSHSTPTREGRSNDDIAASYTNSNVVVENVITDEHLLAEHPRTSELVEATRLKTIFQHRKTWIFTVGLVICAIILSIGVVFGVDNSDDKEKASPTLPPNDIEEVGNTTESFVRDVLPDYSRTALEDPTSAQSLALAWLWKDPIATRDQQAP